MRPVLRVSLFRVNSPTSGVRIDTGNTNDMSVCLILVIEMYKMLSFFSTNKRYFAVTIIWNKKRGSLIHRLILFSRLLRHAVDAVDALNSLPSTQEVKHC